MKYEKLNGENMSARHLCLDSEVSIFATCQKYLARARKLAPKVQRHHKSYGKREKGKFQFFCENIGETHFKDFDTCQFLKYCKSHKYHHNQYNQQIINEPV